MAKILGWLTITGLALIALAIIARVMEVAYPLPIILLCLGGFCFLIAGIPWSRTPGKRLTGLTVVSETLTPPSRIQILLRNITRIVELEPTFSIFVPLLLLVLLTRNRQRVGDLLAHTLVVEPALTLDEPE